MNSFFLPLGLLFLPGLVFAQTTPSSAADVPAINASSTAAARTAPPPPVNLLSGKEATLTPREREAVRISKAWKKSGTRPGRGRGGRVWYRFGSALPTVVCAPLRVCSIDLQPGEVVRAVNVGDPVRWIVTPATSGEGADTTTHVMVKPTDTNLVTNMIISTDRRQYVIELKSRRNDWMPDVAFSYPADEQAAWAKITKAQVAQRRNTIMPATGQNLAALDFGFRLSGDHPSWRPVRVYTDGKKTYIQFPSSMKYSTSPALLALGDDGGLFHGPSKQLVNYRPVNGRYVVDRVLNHAVLISGVGKHQVKVEITRTGGH